MATQLDGVLTALLTPCRPDGTVDEEALAELIAFQAGVGVTGLFVLGTAGLGPMLGEEERIRLAAMIIDAAHPALRVVVHVGALPTATAQRLAAAAAEAGADAVASVPPVYYQPDFRSVELYYRGIRDAAGGLPVLAYNNPPATGCDLRPEQTAQLHAEGTIFGVKQAAASLADLHALLRAGVPTWIANATLNTAALAMGARGAISTITNVLPELFVALYDAMSDGDVALARDLQERIDRGAARLRTPIIGALHAAASARGLPALAPREPLRLPDPDELPRVLEALRELEGFAAPAVAL